MSQASKWLTAKVAEFSKDRKDGKRQICHAAGITYKTLRAYSAGKNDPVLSAAQWEGLATVLNVDVSKVIGVFSHSAGEKVEEF